MADFKPLKIRVDKGVESQEQQITLNGITFFLRFSYSTAYTRDNWVVDILDSNRDNLLVGKRVTSTTNLTYNSIDLTELLDGYLFCVNTKNSKSPITKDNFGSQEVFRIWYIRRESFTDE